MPPHLRSPPRRPCRGAPGEKRRMALLTTRQEHASVDEQLQTQMQILEPSWGSDGFHRKRWAFLGLKAEGAGRSPPRRGASYSAVHLGGKTRFRPALRRKCPSRAAELSRRIGHPSVVVACFSPPRERPDPSRRATPYLPPSPSLDGRLAGDPHLPQRCPPPPMPSANRAAAPPTPPPRKHVARRRRTRPRQRRSRANLCVRGAPVPCVAFPRRRLAPPAPADPPGARQGIAAWARWGGGHPRRAKGLEPTASLQRARALWSSVCMRLRAPQREERVAGGAACDERQSCPIRRCGAERRRAPRRDTETEPRAAPSQAEPPVERRNAAGWGGGEERGRAPAATAGRPLPKRRNGAEPRAPNRRRTPWGAPAH